MASMRLKQKWHAIIATAGMASFRMTGRSGPTVSEPGVPATLVMAPEATGAPGRGSTRRANRAAVSRLVVVQRAVRAVHQDLERCPVPRMHRDADADRERRLLAIARHPVRDPAGDVPRGRVAGLGQHERELVAAEPSGSVDAAAGAEQIGRASCRERVESAGGARAFKRRGGTKVDV